MSKTAESRTFDTYSDYLAWVRRDAPDGQQGEDAASRIIDEAVRAVDAAGPLEDRRATRVHRTAFDKRLERSR